MPVCYQVSMNPYFGGGEVYTRFLVEAMARMGWQTVLFVHRRATYWQRLQRLQLSSCTLVPLDDVYDIENNMPESAQIILSHGTLPVELRKRLSQRHRLLAMVHMPLYDFPPDFYEGYTQVFAVSRYVLQSLHDAGVTYAWHEPWYGVADLLPGLEDAQTPIYRNSRFDWDLRKGRDWLLSKLEPLVQPFLPRPVFQKKTPLTLALVSRLTPIKQFPLMFSILAPILAEFPDVSLEIFGAGGYASVRDLRKALRPASKQVRFWGFQPAVAPIYAQVDFVLSGLPEQEALGLNLLEAQACNCPVLAIDAPPFSETIAHERTGYLYTDPRKDGGAHFRSMLQKLQNQANWPVPWQDPSHLQQFTLDALQQRIERAFAGLGFV